MSEYKCLKCKGEIKRTKTDYGYSYDCPCGKVCIQTTRNVTLLTEDNNING